MSIPQGKWVAVEKLGEVHDSNGELIADVWGGDSFQEEAAITRLIAASPELLEAATAVLAAHESSHGQMDDAFGCDMIDRLKTLIAKATGDTASPAPPPTYTRAELDALNATPDA
jgi:hypothetical protein